MFSQTMPQEVRSILNARFPESKISPYVIPPECDTQYVKLDPRAHPFYKCNLNLDTIPDYAIRIFTGKDQTIMEYFVAILSYKSSYQLFILDSCTYKRGAGERYLYLLKTGGKTNIFDNEHWNEITKFGKLSQHGGATFISFPVDALITNPICGGKFNEVEIRTYVFIKDHFYGFSSAD